MALATLFVTMPFVVRELIPVLEAMDMAEEEAALTLGASEREVFWNVTLPNIRWGLMYGILLTNAVSPAHSFLHYINMVSVIDEYFNILSISSLSGVVGLVTMLLMSSQIFKLLQKTEAKLML